MKKFQGKWQPVKDGNGGAGQVLAHCIHITVSSGNEIGFLTEAEAGALYNELHRLLNISEQLRIPKRY